MNKNNTRSVFRYTAIVTFAQLLAACDIEPVSTGKWDIEIVTDQGIQESVWTIFANGTIDMTNISGETDAIVNDTVLQGSRIIWSGTIPEQNNPERVIEMNFNGTVDGNRLQGTLYSTEGNLTVSGNRQ